MRDINIAIDEKILEGSVADVSSVKGFSTSHKEIVSLTKPAHLSIMPELAITMLTYFASKCSGCSCKKIKGDKFEYMLVEIAANNDNRYIFNLFRKYGIITDKLAIGVSGNLTDIEVYLSAKMMRDLSNFTVDIQAVLTLLLYNLASVCAAVFTKTPKLSYDVATGVVESSEMLTTYIHSYSTLRSITIRELHAEDFSMIAYLRSPYAKIPANPSLSFSGIIYKPATDKTPVQAATLTIKHYGTNNYVILATPNGTCYTDMQLNAFEYAPDADLTMIASAYTNFIPAVTATTVSSKDIATTFKDYIYKPNLEFFDDSEEFLKESLLGGLISTETSFREEKDNDIAKICKTYGFAADESIEEFASDTIKDLYKDDAYAQQLYKQVHPYYDTFDLGTISNNIKGFAKGEIYSMLFIGDSGTGKSTAARVLPYRCGLPYVSINFSVNIEESDVFGSMIPNPEKASADDAEFIWKDGVLTKAVRNGYCVVLEEINFARPGVLGKLNSLLDENRQIDLPTGEIVKAHPNFRMIATSNIAYEGTNRLNKALVNRFDDCTVFEDVDRAKAFEIIKSRTGYKNVEKMNNIYNVYEHIKKFSRENNLNLIISIRQLLNLFTIGKYYKNAEDAVKRILINGAFIEEPEFKEEFEKSVMPTYKLNFKI